MRLPADNDARERAISTLDKHLFLDAGAGCGKTRVLVDRYLAILETPGEDISPQEIIAATFTKKAAGEMKERLRARCRELAVERGEAKWQDVARQLETAPIDTIHGLCSRLLHENAVAARVDPGFAVMEDTDASLLLEEVVRQSLLDRLDEDKETASLLVSEFGMSGACDAIAEVVRERARLVGLLTSGARPLTEDEVRRQWEERSGEVQQLLLKLLLDGPSWQAAKTTLKRFSASVPDDKLEVLRQERLGLVESAEDGKRPLEHRLASLEKLTQGSVRKGKEDNWPAGDAMDQVADALRTFSTASGANKKGIDEVVGAGATETDAASAALTSALAFETDAALGNYQQAKRAMSALDFEDLQLKVRELWEHSPQVLAQYQRRVRHLLIDEFQDTNDLQKDVLWPLSGGGAKLFVVGDAKQSIYRFRNADVTIFNRVREEMSEGDDGQVERLAVNFRSTPAVTASINELFTNDAVMGSEAKAEYEAIYEPLHSHREYDGTAALELQVVMPPESGDEEDDEELDDSLRALREAEANLLARRIDELVAEQFPVFDRSEDVWRPARFGDFGMLFRSTPDLPLYERALRLRGVPYYVLAGRGFYARQEVRDVINCLRALENPLDEVALIGTLRSSLFALSDKTLFWLSRLPGTWYERLQSAGATADGPLANVAPEELEKTRFAAQTLDKLRRRKNRIALSRLINEIVERTGLSATLSTRFAGDQMVSNLRKLADIAGDYEQSGNYSLRGLVQRIEDLVVNEERQGQAPVQEEDSDVVKLLTIHASKGLEWPIVIVPDLARGAGNRGGNLFVSHPSWGVVARANRSDDAPWPPLGTAITRLNEAEEAAEARRLFYVASTRARDLLILSSPLKKWDAAAEKTPLGWLRAALDIDLETPGERPLMRGDWSGTARVVLSTDVVAPRPGARTTAQPLIDRVSPEDIAEGALAAIADGAMVSQLIRNVSPVALNYSAKQRFHATELATYLECPRRYRLRYILGAPEQMPSPPAMDAQEHLSATELGDVVHKLLQIAGTGGMERFEQALDDGLGFDVDLAPRARRSMDEIRAMLNWYLSSDLYEELVRPAGRLRTEMTVLFEMDKCLIEGKIDALIEDAQGAVHLLDFKTGKRDAQSAGEHQFQLGLYCEGVRRVTQRQIASAHIAYIGEGEFKGVDPAEAGQAALERAAQAIRGIRDGSFDTEKDERCKACRLRWACDHAE